MSSVVHKYVHSGEMCGVKPSDIMEAMEFLEKKFENQTREEVLDMMTGSRLSDDLDALIVCELENCCLDSADSAL